MGACIECDSPFEEEEGVQHVCDECGTLQPESGSWAIEDLETIAINEKQGKYSEVADGLLELYRQSTDHTYSDWPFAWKIAERLEKLFEEHGLIDQHIAFIIDNITIQRMQNGYRDQQSLEKGLFLARKGKRPDLESELVDAMGRG